VKAEDDGMRLEAEGATTEATSTASQGDMCSFSPKLNLNDMGGSPTEKNGVAGAAAV